MTMKSAIAANRFGLGARPGDLERVRNNPAGWLIDQLQGPSRLPGELKGLPTTAEVLVEVQELRRKDRDMGKLANGAPDPDFVKMYGRTVRRHYTEQAQARYQLAASTDYSFYERLVHFWSNHFAVSADLVFKER